MDRRTKGLDRCSTADCSSVTIEETNSSLAWTDISEAPIASGGSPLAQRGQDHSDAVDARVHLVVVDRIAARPSQPDLPQQPVERLDAALGACGKCWGPVNLAAISVSLSVVSKALPTAVGAAGNRLPTLAMRRIGACPSCLAR